MSFVISASHKGLKNYVGSLNKWVNDAKFARRFDTRDEAELEMAATVLRNEWGLRYSFRVEELPA